MWIQSLIEVMYAVFPNGLQLWHLYCIWKWNSVTIWAGWGGVRRWVHGSRFLWNERTEVSVTTWPDIKNVGHIVNVSIIKALLLHHHTFSISTQLAYSLHTDCQKLQDPIWLAGTMRFLIGWHDLSNPPLYGINAKNSECSWRSYRPLLSKRFLARTNCKVDQMLPAHVHLNIMDIHKRNLR